MRVTLHDSRDTLPDISEQHILVFTGFTQNTNDDAPEITTEVTCRYPVGEQLLEYRRNSDAANQRFEEALDWAAKHAEVVGISHIHAVFELNRPIEPMFLEHLCPHGFEDLRRRANSQVQSAVAPVPAWPAAASLKRSHQMSPLRRYYVFRNRKGKPGAMRQASSL